MPRRKTYLIASLFDDCDTNDMKIINCNTVKQTDENNEECETFRKMKHDMPRCSDKREELRNIAPKPDGTFCRRTLPMPIIQNNLQNFPSNELSQFFLHRTMVPTNLQALSSYNLPQLMNARYQILQMQQAAIQHLSSPLLSSALTSTSQLLSFNSLKAISGQFSFNQTSKHQQRHHFLMMRNQNQSIVKKYRCDVCDKTFGRSNTLVTHKRIHTGEKPFHCNHCGRAFRQPGNLTRHRFTHTTVKPYVCSICKKAFNRASNLHTHMRTHSQLFRTKIAAIQSFGPI